MINYKTFFIALGLLATLPTANGLELPTDAQQLGFGEPVTISLDAREVIWFRLNNQAGAHRLATVKSDGGMPLSVTAYDVDGNLVGDDTFRLQSADLFLEVSHYYRQAGTAEFQIENVPDVDFFEPNNTIEAATFLQPGLAVRAQLFPRADQDIYRVEVGQRGYLTPNLRWDDEAGPAVGWHLLSADGEVVEKLNYAGESFFVEAGRHWLKPVYRYNKLHTASHVVRIDFEPMAKPEQADVKPGDIIEWQPAARAPREYNIHFDEAGWFYLQTLAEPFASSIRFNDEAYRGAVWVEPGIVPLTLHGAYNNYSTNVARHQVRLATANTHLPAQQQEPIPLHSNTTLTVSATHPAIVRIRPNGEHWYARLQNFQAPFHPHNSPMVDEIKVEIVDLASGAVKPLLLQDIQSTAGDYALQISLTDSRNREFPVFLDLALHTVIAQQADPDAALAISVIDLSQDQNAGLQDMALSAGANFVALQEAGSLAAAIETTVEHTRAFEDESTLSHWWWVLLLVPLGALTLLRRR